MSNSSPDWPALPEGVPLLPVVQFRAEDPRLQVFYALDDAIRAAGACPQDEFYDVRGILLTRAESEDGWPRLTADGEGNPAEVQERLVVEARHILECAERDGDVDVEDLKVPDWLQAAPGLAYAVNGLGLARPTYSIFSLHCRRCSAYQKAAWGSPPCCPF